MLVQVVTYRVVGASVDEWRAGCRDAFAEPVAALDGLIAKVWLEDVESMTFGGVYLWRDAASIEAFQRSEVFKTFVSHPGVKDIEARVFDTYEEATRITRGMPAAAMV